MTGERLAREQLRRNGELLLRRRPPRTAGLRPVENSTWSEGWTALYEERPDLRPRLERSAVLPRNRLADELAAALVPEREYVLVVSVHGHPEAIGVAAATLAGPAGAVGSYVVELVEDGQEGLVVLDEPGGTALLVDQDQEDGGTVLFQQYRWPEVED
jgi:hypothetical protein